MTGVWSPGTISGGLSWNNWPCSGLWEPLFSLLAHLVDVKDAPLSGGDGDGVG